MTDAQAAGPGHRWLLELREEPVTVPGDTHRLHQVLANLLANARLHTPVGSTVTVSLEADDTTALLKVHDDGPGVAADVRSKVFERFTHADRRRPEDANGGTGTGLGLSIVAAVTEAHTTEASPWKAPRDRPRSPSDCRSPRACRPCNGA